MHHRFQRVLIFLGILGFFRRASLGDDFLQNVQIGYVGRVVAKGRYGHG